MSDMFDSFTCQELRGARAELNDPTERRTREELLDDRAMVDLINAELARRARLNGDDR